MAAAENELVIRRTLPAMTPRAPAPSTINEKTIADFTRVVERLRRVAMSGHSLTLRTSPGRSISAFRVIVSRCRESAAT